MVNYAEGGEKAKLLCMIVFVIRRLNYVIKVKMNDWIWVWDEKVKVVISENRISKRLFGINNSKAFVCIFFS